MKIKMLKGKAKGEIFEARPLRKSVLDPRPSFQILEGCFMGEIVPYEYCIEIEEKESLSDDKWHKITTEVDAKLALWIDEKYVGSPVADRKGFSKGLVDFIKEELSKR
ncbi:hypothetical protein [Halalkalibacter krulwichiae]|uniref:Uncharacterized protein n=1 Tax=Halalkalibacter krulwichiae TaxID=199441 RepID=A0A1X9MFD2_9BACI|nr:hypothetical protein [Halalkalibacter krulwichiae]ARK32165.1 hypothetical protein BkAM31D_21230 [Halalkalibacter krulwichiae]